MFTAHYGKSLIVETAAKAYRAACGGMSGNIQVGNNFVCRIDWDAQKVIVSSECYNFDVSMNDENFMPTVERLGRK